MRNVVLLLCAFLLCTTFAAASVPNVGNPSFDPISSNNMALRYGFNGAAVYADGRWYFHRMTTITRSRVRGHVNQINDNFALAVGLHEFAIFDFSKKQWVVYRGNNVSADDSTAQLRTNMVLTPSYARVKILNGPFVQYTTQKGWHRVN